MSFCANLLKIGPAMSVTGMAIIIPYSAYTREGDISALGSQKEFKASEMPSFGLSILTAVLPVYKQMG
jgi:GntP family gluconate:H+ symporter